MAGCLVWGCPNLTATRPDRPDPTRPDPAGAWRHLGRRRRGEGGGGVLEGVAPPLAWGPATDVPARFSEILKF